MDFISVKIKFFVYLLLISVLLKTCSSFPATRRDNYLDENFMRNSKFLGLPNEERQINHKKNNHQGLMNPCIRTDAEGKFLWGINVYNVYPAQGFFPGGGEGFNCAPLSYTSGAQPTRLQSFLSAWLRPTTTVQDSGVGSQVATTNSISRPAEMPLGTGEIIIGVANTVNAVIQTIIRGGRV